MKTDKFGEGEGTILKNFMLVRKLYLKEKLSVEVGICDICDLNREILYWGSYDRDRNVECFNVCERCGKNLMEGSAEILESLGVGGRLKD